MARQFSKCFYNSKAWKECRESIVIKYLGICKECGGIGQEVHHIVPLSPKNIDDPEITLSENNLILLCRDCHMKKHKKESKVTVRGLRFNDKGELVKE